MSIIRKNSDKKVVAEIISKIRENGGYCPCQLQRTEDTKCMCKDFLDNVVEGPCHCGLYIKSK